MITSIKYLILEMKSSISAAFTLFWSFLSTAPNDVNGLEIFRKRREKRRLQLEQRLPEQVFGRLVEEETFEYLSSYSYSLSFSFSYPDVSLSYPMNEYPSTSPTKTVGLPPTAAPSELTSTPSPTTISTQVPPTLRPSSTPTMLDTSDTSISQPSEAPSEVSTPYDIYSNDNSGPPSISNEVLNEDIIQPTDQPTADNQNSNNVMVNSNADGEVNGNVDKFSSTTAYLVPIVGVAAGVLIIGVAVRAIDRRNGPTQYVNLDADSQSSFSLNA